MARQRDVDGGRCRDRRCTAGILPAARILRAAPLPKDSRASATTLVSVQVTWSSPCGPRSGVSVQLERMRVRKAVKLCFHRVDHGCREGGPGLRRHPSPKFNRPVRSRALPDILPESIHESTSGRRGGRLRWRTRSRDDENPSQPRSASLLVDDGARASASSPTWPVRTVPSCGSSGAHGLADRGTAARRRRDVVDGARGDRGSTDRRGHAPGRRPPAALDVDFSPHGPPRGRDFARRSRVTPGCPRIPGL